jgi:hypothetical protein
MARWGCGLVVLLVWASSASAAGHLYWTNAGGDNIGRADRDGGRIQPRFITGATTSTMTATNPRAVAVAGNQLVWARGGDGGTIGRARRDGSGVDDTFLPAGGYPQSVATDGTSVHWTHFEANMGFVGRAGLDGTALDPTFLPTATQSCGVAIGAGGIVYWANGGSIARAHGPMDVDPMFIPRVGSPCGLAVTRHYIYWVGRHDAIGRARLDGTDVRPRFIVANGQCALAVDSRYIYWTDFGGTIARAKLDGRGVTALITGATGACGIAVDPTMEAVPSAGPRGSPGTGRRSGIRSVLVANTSSSTLDVERIGISGPARRDFVKTADGCEVDFVLPSGRCRFSLRFRPRRVGPRLASVRITAIGAPPVTVRVRGRGR